MLVTADILDSCDGALYRAADDCTFLTRYCQVCELQAWPRGRSAPVAANALNQTILKPLLDRSRKRSALACVSCERA